jgi:epoxyqueuosine reductase
LSSASHLGALGDLRARCAREGLNLVLPVECARFDAAASARGGATLDAWWPGVRAAVVIGDGGPAFFQGFTGRRDAQPQPHLHPMPGGGASAALEPLAAATGPLDAFTTARVLAIARAALGDAPGTWRVVFPFGRGDGEPALPFQHLGMAAGLPAPGPLGLQIHPTYGPWWAYRAALLSRLPVADAATGSLVPEPLSDACATCAGPCRSACPAAAVLSAGFVFAPCRARRLAEGSSCAHACVARLACPVGGGYAYGTSQIAFHMEASLVSLRRSRAAPA